MLGFFGRFWWVLDLFSHFRLQYFLSLFLLVVILLVGRKKRLVLLFAVFTGLNAAVTIPLYFPGQPAPSHPQRIYRAMLANVNTRAGDPLRVAKGLENTIPIFWCWKKWILNGSQVSSQLRHPIRSQRPAPGEITSVLPYSVKYRLEMQKSYTSEERVFPPS